MAAPQVVFMAEPELGFELVVSSGRTVSYPVHTHVSTYTLGLIRHGTVTLKNNGKTTRLRAGGLFRLEPNQAHSLAASRPYAIVNLCLDQVVVDGDPRRLEAVAERLDALAGAGQLLPGEADILAAAVRQLGDRKKNGTPRQPDRLDRLKAAIEAHPELELNLDGMAAAARLDRFQLIRAFRRRFGLPPRRFQIQSRVRKARREYMDSASLTSAALLAGFYDQSHFIRNFKKLLRLTPRQYRAARRKAPK